jgi:beta-lactam-binding protein with PASTA domain
MRRNLMVFVVAMALAAAGCGGSDTENRSSTDSAEAVALQDRVERLESEAKKRESEAARKVRAAERRARAAQRKAKAARRKAKRERARARERASDADVVEVAAEQAAGGITVPNVVGLDHQAAQDAMQGEGLWLLDEEDCTGQGRMLLWDRNWEVVSTDPPAGTQVSEDTTITLCSKKQGE